MNTGLDSEIVADFRLLQSVYKELTKPSKNRQYCDLAGFIEKFIFLLALFVKMKQIFKKADLVSMLLGEHSPVPQF
jgi:hypothetical protein